MQKITWGNENDLAEDVLELACRINHALAQAILYVATRQTNEKVNLNQAINWLTWFRNNLAAVNYHSSPIAATGKQQNEANFYIQKIMKETNDKLLLFFLKNLFTWEYKVQDWSINKAIHFINIRLNNLEDKSKRKK